MNDASNLILKCFLHTSRLLFMVKLSFFSTWAHFASVFCFQILERFCLDKNNKFQRLTKKYYSK